jgi:hypothetical protein
MSSCLKKPMGRKSRVVVLVIIQAFWWLRQKDLELKFEASLAYIGRPCLKRKINKPRGGEVVQW